jgi:hypothetical protein
VEFDMSSAATDKRISWQALIGGAVTLVTLVGGGIGIAQYYQQEKIPDLTGTWTNDRSNVQPEQIRLKSRQDSHSQCSWQRKSRFRARW